MEEYFTLYGQWWKTIKTLPDKIRLDVFDALCSYAFEDSLPDNSEISSIVGSLFASIDKDREKSRPDVTDKAEQQFERFRKAYPGTKRSFNVEFTNFRRKNPKDWRTIAPQLFPALERLMKWHAESEAAGRFTPQYKNLSTWINQKCWTEELPQIPETNGSTKTSRTDNDGQSEFTRYIFDKIESPDASDTDLSRYY